MDPAMAVKAHGEKIPNIVQLVANSSGLVVNLRRGTAMTDLAYWIFS
jgi:hypothetical protein